MTTPQGLTRAQKLEFERYVELGKRIKRSTAAPLNESTQQQEDRVKRLLSNHVEFCRYYLPIYMDSDFAWFHLLAHKRLAENPNYNGVWRWPREHAKSVFATIMEPLYFKALGQVSGLVLGSSTETKAAGLLHDLQAVLSENERYRADFGDQRVYGDWAANHFVTQDGTGFWAFGAGQSPRGAREQEKRPNYGIIDDIDTEELVRNESRVDETVKWVNEAFIGTLAIKGGKRFMLVGNRIGKYSVNALVAGDVGPDDKVKPTCDLIEVFALENPRTHKADQTDTGVPAWKERYTRQELLTRFAEIGRRATNREFFHKHETEGKVFKKEWFQYDKLPPLKRLPYHVTYNDPSFRESKKNDFKAIVWVAKNGGTFYIVDCWVRQASTKGMVAAHFDMAMLHDPNHELRVSHYYEANAMQDVHQTEYDTERTARSYELFIKQDDRAKPNKVERIGKLDVLFERGLVVVNVAIKNKVDWQTLLDQFADFPNGHDDGPDAFEGAVHALNKMARTDVPPLLGAQRRYNANNRL